jgi:hypothetical protein
MCTKCDDDDNKLQAMKRAKLAAYVTVLLFAKYSFWSFLYRRYSQVKEEKTFKAD